MKRGSLIVLAVLSWVLLPGPACSRDPRPTLKTRPLHFVYGKSRVLNPRPIPRFVVPPKKSGVVYKEFLVLGDQGTGGAGQQLVAQMMARFARRYPVDLILTTGDNIYPNGVVSLDDPQWQQKFEKIYVQKSLQRRFYATLGNHDYRYKPKVQIAYTNRSNCRCSCSADWKCRCRELKAGRKCWIMPHNYYRFQLPLGGGNYAEFFAIDTTPMSYQSGWHYNKKLVTRQLNWLSTSLAQSKARWKIVFGHHVVLSGGRHGPNRRLSGMLRPILRKHKVDLHLAGHDHDLQLIKPKNFVGVHYVVSGGGGKSRDVRWTPESLYAATNFGFVAVRMSTNQLLIRFLDRNGRVRFAYTIKKP